MNRGAGSQPTLGNRGVVPDLLTIEVSGNDGEIVVALVGELDLSTRQRLTDALIELERTPPTRLVIDLARLSFLDSTGLALFVTLDKRCRDNGGPTLEIRPGPPAVQRLFDLVGAADRLPFSTTGGTSTIRVKSGRLRGLPLAE
jgi:anti-sigma B factor antagonist